MRTNKPWFALLTAFIIGAFVLTSCATIFKGTTDTVKLATTPAGAEVFINGNQMGTTPLEIELESNGSYLIEFKMKGYLDQVYRIHSSLIGGYLVLDVLFGIVPAVVDAVTGAWMTLDPDTVHVPLKPAQ